MSQIRGILFDKDGTVISFHSLWVTIAKQLVTRFCHRFQITSPEARKKLLTSIGIGEREVVAANGILASGTTKDIEEVFLHAIDGQGRDKLLEKWVKDQLFQLTRDNLDKIQPTADLENLLPLLKQHGLKLGMATADDLATTTLCLNKVNILHFFDFIGTSDRFAKKPHPEMFHAFCFTAGLKAEEVAVVGDTLVDMRFARNGGAALAIGVLSGAGTRPELSSHADIIIPSIAELVHEDGTLIWEDHMMESFGN